MYQGLLGYDPNTYAVQPELAQKWEQVSPTELVFHLQSGVKWHNKPPVSGRELTAEDVVFSLNRVRTNDPLYANRSLYANFDKIEAVDKATVRVTTKGPDATALSYLSADPALVLAPEAIQKFGKLATPESVIGIGPFLMKSLEQNVRCEYERNPDYWKPGRPYLDGVRTQQFDDPAAAYTAFQGGQIDITLLPGQEVKNYVAKLPKDSSPSWFKEDNTFFPCLQPNTRTKPLDDPRVTRALRLLIDHQEFLTAWCDTWFGRGRPGAFFPVGMEQWDLSEEEYGKLLEWKMPKDDAVKEAMSILSAAGYSKDNPLSFEISGQTQGYTSAANQLVQAQWTRLGNGAVKPTLKEYDLPALTAIRANKTFTYLVSGNGAAFPDPDSWLVTMYATGGTRNYASFSDAKLDAMIQQQRTMLDLSQRKAFVKEMVTYMLDSCPMEGAVNHYAPNAVKPKVQDFAPEFNLNGRQYEWIWLSA